MLNDHLESKQCKGTNRKVASLEVTFPFEKRGKRGICVTNHCSNPPRPPLERGGAFSMLYQRLAIFVLICAAACPGTFASEMERGKVLPDVKCTRDVKFSYALYLPSGYSENKVWPVIFCFAPDAKGDVPVRLLQKPAEEFGFILAGSNDSQNGPWPPIVKAQEALWEEVNSRYRVDPRRSYAMGFSGGSRAGLYLAESKKGRFAGMLSCGAFSSEHGDVTKGSGMCFVLISGETDFNYYEMSAAARKLEKLGLPNWLERFDGGHRWPPEALLYDALSLLQADAMMRDLAPRDDKFIDRLVSKYSARAASLDSAGKKKKARDLYANLARIFKSWPGSAPAAGEALKLTGDGEVRAAEEAERRSEEYAGRLILAKDRRSYSVIVKELENERAKGGAAAENAERVLRMASFQLGQKGAEELRLGDLSQAKQDLEAATAIFPEDPTLNYNAACANARMGRTNDAISFLEKAVNCGFSQFELLKRDSDLDRIRKEPEFVEFIKRVSERAGKPAGGNR